MIRLEPPAGYSLRGQAYRAKKDYDRAIADYSEAIKLEPGSAFRYSDRAGVYAERKDYDRAIADHSEAIKLDPKSAVMYSNRGNSHYERKNFDQAIADYSEGIKLSPKEAAMYLRRGNTYFEKKDYDRAIVDFSEAIKLDPKFTLAYNNRGTVFYFKKDYDRAIADYDEALKLEPNHSDARKSREDAQQARRASVAPQQSKESVTNRWLRNLTPVALDVIHDGKTVCSLAPDQGCMYPGPAGQHAIELRRRDGKTIRKTVSTLHPVVCPKDFGTSERPARRRAIESPGDWTRIAAAARRIAATRRRIRPSSRAQGARARREASARGDRQARRDALARKIFPGPPGTQHSAGVSEGPLLAVVACP